ncbi:MAG: hypothetical protein Q8903_00495 [Bacteroidota bacterium]|nr:hypothetical protein [Bacteroidota bacterium]
MKKVLWLQLFMFLFSCINYSQNINVQVLVNPNPTPYINLWKSNPAALGSIIISNQSGNRDVKVRAAIRLQGSGTVFKCLTGNIRIKNVTTLTADKFLQFDNVEYPDANIKNIVLQSGRLPEGSYNLCIKIEDQNGAVLTDNTCATFSIVYPMQPQLLAPMNNSELSIQTTTFQWTPILVPGKYNVHYILKIAEVLQGQSPAQALNSNDPFFLKEDIQTNVFIYSNNGQQFQVNKKYVWQVQVLDQFGIPPTAQQGKSEIFVFKYKNLQISPKDFPVVVYPLNLKHISVVRPEFKWNYKLNNAAVNYRITVAPRYSGQTGQYAFDNNAPIFRKTVKGITNYIPAGDLPFSINGDYIIRVQVMDDDENVISSSDINNFSYSIAEPVIMSPVKNSSITDLRPEFKWNCEYQGGNVNYRITVVPKYAGQNDQYAFINNPPIFKKTVKGIKSYVPTGNLPFVNKSDYVICVQVVNEDESVLSSSELFTCKYTFIEPVLVSPLNNGVVYHYKNEFKWDYAKNSNKVRYNLKIAVLNGGQTPGNAINNNAPFYSKIITGALNYIPENNIMFQENTKYVYIVRVIDSSNNVIASSDIKVFTFNPSVEQTSTVTGNLFYEFDDHKENGISDFKGVGVKLVVRYIFHIKSHSLISGGTTKTEPRNGEIDISDDETFIWDYYHIKDVNRVLGYSNTGANGNFSFTFNNKDSLGQLVAANVDIGSTNGEFRNFVTGDVYKVARVMLLRQAGYYYTNPDDCITVAPGQSVNITQAICGVRSYQTVFTVKPEINNENQISHIPLSDMDVYLLRKNRPSLVPFREGYPKPILPGNYVDYEIVAQGKSSILTDNLGQIAFSSMVRNQENNDEYYIYAKSDPEKGNLNYETPVMIPVKFTFPQDKAVFRGEYHYPTVYQDIFASPLPPSVWGTVNRSDNGVPMKDANVYLYKNDEVESIHNTGEDGYFPKFAYLNTEFDGSGHINGPVRDIGVYKPGYKNFRKQIAGHGNNRALMLGEKSFQVITIQPGMTVDGCIVDETGSGVNALVKIGEGPFVRAVSNGYYPNPNHWNPSAFTSQAEIAYNVPIIIQPDDHSYYDEYLTDNTIGWNSTKTFTVYKKLHRIKIFVYERGGGEFPAQVANAKVRIKVQNSFLEKIADANSNFVEFSFQNDDSTFSVQVLSPDGKYYETLNTIITNSVSKTAKSYSLTLKKASFVSGRVLVGTDNTPVPYAHVFIDQGGALIETYTNNTGNFQLKNVPVNVPLTIWAAKHSTNTTYIGDSVKITVSLSGKSNLDFNLKTYDGIDITNLFGFPIEVNALNDKNGKIQIKGRFINIPKNNQFALVNQNESLGFDSIYIKPSSRIKNSKGVPIGEPVDQIVRTNRNTIDIKVYNAFNAVIYDNKIGVHLTDAGTGMGVVKGEVNIIASAFNTQGKVSALNFYLWDPNIPVNNQNVKIPVFTHDGHNPISTNKGLKALGHDGKAIAMTINGFKTKIDSLNSYLNGDSLKLGTKIFCTVPGFSADDQAIDLGTLIIHPGGVDPIESKTAINIPLKSVNSDWSINAQEWSFANDLVISKGVLKVATIDVPIQTFTIKKNSLGDKQFSLNTLNIAKIIPLNITGKVIVDYNSSDSWYLFLSPGTSNYSAYFAGLPGAEDTAKLYLQSVKVTSKGKMQIAPWAAQPAIRIYSVTKLQPDMIDFYDEAISITGLKFDPGIPDFSGTSSVKYETNSGSTKLTCMPFNITIWDKGVLLKFGVNTEQALSQVLNQNGFKSYGNISEPGKFKELNAWLYHNNDSTSVIVENPFSPDKKSNTWQTLNIGANKTYLDKLTGRMPVINGSWDFFSFSGDLTGTKGVTDDNKRMSFIVKGEVEADNQKISIKNIPTPFGDLKLTYDFENQRLEGNMQINQEAGGIQLYGAANLRIDGDGWYFFAGGTSTIPGSGPVKMAMLFGDYPRIEQYIKDEFAKTSYKKSLPASFTNSISGFFMSGSAEFPIIIPSVSIWLAVATFEIGDDAGLDTRIWCSFDGKGSEYGIGNLGFVHIWAKLKTIICTELGGSLTQDLGYEGTYNTATHAISLDVCTSLSLKVWLQQKTPITLLTGIECVEPYLFDVDEGIDFRAKVHMDTNGGSNLKVEKGTCHD